MNEKILKSTITQIENFITSILHNEDYDLKSILILVLTFISECLKKELEKKENYYI